MTMNLQRKSKPQFSLEYVKPLRHHQIRIICLITLTLIAGLCLYYTISKVNSTSFMLSRIKKKQRMNYAIVFAQRF